MSPKDWGLEAHYAGEAALDELMETAQSEGDCECPTCIVREVLLAAVPIIARGIVAGDLDPSDLAGDE